MKYLDVKQAAEYCCCSVQTIYNSRHKTGLPKRKPAFRKLIFDIADLDAWLATPPKKTARPKTA